MFNLLKQLQKRFTQNGTTTEPVNTNQELPKQEELLEQHDVTNTIFTIVGNKLRGYAITVGKHRLSDWQSKKQCHDQINQKDWHLIFALMSVAIDYQEFQNTQKPKK